MGGDLNGVRKEHQAVRAKIKQIEEALKTIDDDIKTLQDELTSVTEKRGRTYESMQQLRKNRDEGVRLFFFFYLINSVYLKSLVSSIIRDWCLFLMLPSFHIHFVITRFEMLSFLVDVIMFSERPLLSKPIDHEQS